MEIAPGLPFYKAYGLPRRVQHVPEAGALVRLRNEAARPRSEPGRGITCSRSSAYSGPPCGRGPCLAPALTRGPLHLHGIHVDSSRDPVLCRQGHGASLQRRELPGCAPIAEGVVAIDAKKTGCDPRCGGLARSAGAIGKSPRGVAGQPGRPVQHSSQRPVSNHVPVRSWSRMGGAL